MWTIARFFPFVTVQRPWIAVASVTNRTHSPADCRLRFQTGGRTIFSARAGSRSNGALVSAQPCPSTPSGRTSYHSSSPFSSGFAVAGSMTWAVAVSGSKANTTSAASRGMGSLVDGAKRVERLLADHTGTVEPAAAVQPADRGHLLGAQVEVEHGEVLGQPLRPRGLRHDR